jgi:hypothetical protein
VSVVFVEGQALIRGGGRGRGASGDASLLLRWSCGGGGYYDSASFEVATGVDEVLVMMFEEWFWDIYGVDVHNKQSASRRLMFNISSSTVQYTSCSNQWSRESRILRSAFAGRRCNNVRSSGAALELDAS